MYWLLTTIPSAIAAFIATNLDDLILLMLFFSQKNSSLTAKDVVVGQYLGFLTLLIASIPGYFGGQLLADHWIGLLGLLPIVIGIVQLFDHDDEAEEIQAVSETFASPANIPFQSLFIHLMNPGIYKVAAVTVANGGDNIGIYVPLFASFRLPQLIVTLLIFLGMVGLWCKMAAYLTNHRTIAPLVTRYGHRIAPFVLIALGMFILWENGTLNPESWLSGSLPSLTSVQSAELAAHKLGFLKQG